jgi:predicted acetylornithine/succinylornithine family transaminase
MRTLSTDPRAALLGVYRPADALFVRGEGTELVDESGTRYLDFTSGIGVNALGHGHPAIARAVEEVVRTGLLHASNLFRTAPAEELAGVLCGLAGLDRAFFCNSGAESVEGALKFARKWAKARGGGEKHRIVALRGGFHGRLFGSLAVTDRPDFRAPFEPLMPGVDFADPMNPGEVDRLLDPERTAALIVEPIQGEGGIRALAPETLRSMREWTAERGIALILDEIQCGLGRTGTLFAFEPSGIRPDLLCLAKPLGGGLPIGAILVSNDIAAVMEPGDHGTTFGGGPLVSTVALRVMEIVSEPGFLADVVERGNVLARLLSALAVELEPVVREVRGRGLMWGIEVAAMVGPVVQRLREEGLLTVPAGAHVIRLLPPLTVSRDEIGRAVEILRSVLAEPLG